MILTLMQLDLPIHVLFVDDGSPDGTAAVIQSYQTRYSDRIHLIQRKGKLGLGTAYIAGFQWALERKYDFICEMGSGIFKLSQFDYGS